VNCSEKWLWHHNPRKATGMSRAPGWGCVPELLDMIVRRGMTACTEAEDQATRGCAYLFAGMFTYSSAWSMDVRRSTAVLRAAEHGRHQVHLLVCAAVVVPVEHGFLAAFVSNNQHTATLTVAHDVQQEL
jgi:hypothetical protein